MLYVLRAPAADTSFKAIPPDPRSTLRAGYEDAGQAAENMTLAAHLPLPPGFIDPVNPTGFIMPAAAPMPGKDSPGSPAPPLELPKPPDKAPKSGAPPFAFANSDIVFSGDRLFIGNFHGFNTYDISIHDAPKLIASTVCPGGQADLSVYGNLLFLSVEQPFARLDCGTQGVAEPVSPERFRGIRIFDISELNNPRQVAAVQTCRGSHTNTLVPDRKDPQTIYLLSSATSYIRSAAELAGCSDKPDDPNTALFRIDVIRVPLNAPEQAAIVSQPRIFADSQTGAVAGLWKGGDYGAGTQASNATDNCHDITAYPLLSLAAGACFGNGILLDITDPAHPVRIAAVADPNFAFWHSATFSNDGSKVVFTDEWGGGTRPRCRSTDPVNWGADAVYDIVDRKLEFRSYYKMPAPQGELENCVAHNGGLVPVPGRDILVQAWYQGGVSVVDFTDSAHPVEIAYFDRGPVDGTRLRLGGHWSAYWYRDRIYASETARGLDVLKLLPSNYLTSDELAAASLAREDATLTRGGALNPQTQPHLVWPDSPVVARAYLDQLRRSRFISGARAAAVEAAMHRLENGRDPSDSSHLRALAAQMQSLGRRLAGRDSARALELYRILNVLAG
jgi:hypothetical protein